MLALTFLFSSSAGAQGPDGAYVGNEVTTTTVGSTNDSEVLANSDESDSKVLANSDSNSANRLAFTGSDSVLLATIGAIAIAAGGSILLLRRRVAS